MPKSLTGNRVVYLYISLNFWLKITFECAFAILEHCYNLSIKFSVGFDCSWWLEFLQEFPCWRNACKLALQIMSCFLVYREHLTGTDWALVTTNDGKKYYYNSKMKVWYWIWILVSYVGKLFIPVSSGLDVLFQYNLALWYK